MILKHKEGIYKRKDTYSDCRHTKLRRKKLEIPSNSLSKKTSIPLKIHVHKL